MCGLFGQINTKVEKFNYPIFCTLGIVNNNRGGDSCGLFIDGKTEYGIDKTKEFPNFMVKSDLLDKTKECKIAFGHCRKTSVGATSLETAQPVVIKEDNVIKFVLMHNGTIYNIDELAQKYVPNLDIKGMSDSQVMAHIFYAGHYEALKEYNGSAVFVIADYRKNAENPKILWFKGESKTSEVSIVTSEERPFYFVKHNKTIFFSSTFSILLPFCKDDDVYETDTNILYELKNCELYEVKKYDRTKQCQTKITKTDCNLVKVARDIYGYNSYERNNYYNGYNNEYYNFNSKQHLPMPFNTDSYKDFDTTHVTRFEKWDEARSGDDLLCYTKSVTNVLHGGFYISNGGFINTDKSTTNTECWFWQGTLLKNKLCFNFLMKVMYNLGYDEVELSVNFPELLCYLAAQPIFSEADELIVNENEEPFSGNIEIPFSKRTISVEKGKVKSTTYKTFDTDLEVILSKFEYYDPSMDETVMNLYC